MAQEKTETIIVGNAPAEYLAFGDDSHHQNTLVYAFLIIKESLIASVENRVNAIKAFYGILDNIILHCKMLFSGDERRKAGIAYLSSEKVRSIITRIVRIINETPIFLRYAYCNLEDQKIHFDKLNAEETDEENKAPKKIQLAPDSKGLLGRLAHISLSTLPRDPCIPTINKCQVVVSEDKTKVHFIGKNRRQAHYWISGFSDIGVPLNSVFQLHPIIKKSHESIMLQLADMAAYMCCQALSEGSNSLFFREKLKEIKYWTSANLIPNEVFLYPEPKIYA
ncbi:MAG: hypothetical protein K0R24_1598 [Gammaproteobacteria bacterium]|jgi:hypothetical protein|nr:hypothetical protein [Gammaproteobacteria bacterium]